MVAQFSCCLIQLQHCCYQRRSKARLKNICYSWAMLTIVEDGAGVGLQISRRDLHGHSVSVQFLLATLVVILPQVDLGFDLQTAALH